MVDCVKHTYVRTRELLTPPQVTSTIALLFTLIQGIFFTSMFMCFTLILQCNRIGKE